MNYVFKIMGDFNEKNFCKLLTKISQDFVFIYFDKALFIAQKHYSISKFSVEKLCEYFKSIKNFYIEEVTEKNVGFLSPVAKDWCLNNLVRLDTERYESENQIKLQKIWKAMDAMEQELSKKKQEQEKNN